MGYPYAYAEITRFKKHYLGKTIRESDVKNWLECHFPFLVESLE